LPIYLFSAIRRGVTPEINVIATVVMTVSLTLLVIVQQLLQRQRRPQPAKA
jgi:spermidine/putrescine transport system permease protein